MRFEVQEFLKFACTEIRQLTEDIHLKPMHARDYWVIWLWARTTRPAAAAASSNGTSSITARFSPSRSGSNRTRTSALSGREF